MYIIKIEANENGSHANQNSEHLAYPPEGYAIIPEDMEIPSSFPFVDIVVQEQLYYVSAEDGTEKISYSAPTVISMSEREMAPSSLDSTVPWREKMEAQIAYTAMMTNTLLEE